MLPLETGNLTSKSAGSSLIHVHLLPVLNWKVDLRGNRASFSDNLEKSFNHMPRRYGRSRFPAFVSPCSVSQIIYSAALVVRFLLTLFLLGVLPCWRVEWLRCLVSLASFLVVTLQRNVALLYSSVMYPPSCSAHFLLTGGKFSTQIKFLLLQWQKSYLSSAEFFLAIQGNNLQLYTILLKQQWIFSSLTRSWWQSLSAIFTASILSCDDFNGIKWFDHTNIPPYV